MDNKCTLPGVDLKINIKEKKANWINKQSNSPLKDDSGSFQFHHELEGRFYSKHNRYQLSISNLLSILQLNIPNDALCVIGLTMSDLYREEADLFVAGWAELDKFIKIYKIFSMKVSNRKKINFAIRILLTEIPTCVYKCLFNSI
jgi:hypothetical protein